jgi:serine/threonine protein kinase
VKEADDLQPLFLELRELAPGPRERRLAELRERDAELTLALEELLRADESCSGFLAQPALDSWERWSMIEAEESSLVEVPERIGRYLIQGVLGRGGMGVVYRALDQETRRAVALKVLRDSRFSPSSLRRFEHEAELLARLAHPGVARVFEAGLLSEGGRSRAFIAMELVSGMDLRTHLTVTRPSLRERLGLLRGITEAMAHAHERGIVHRDLKPENVLLDAAGTPKVVDFGVARLVTPEAEPATPPSEEGRLVGTLWYMSPEQIFGEPDSVDVRADVYALGVLGYELCAGRLPHPLEGRSLAEVASLIRSAEPAPVPELERALPDLVVVLRKCLAKAPEQRYASAAELSAELARVARDQPIRARPATWAYRLRKLVHRHRNLAAALGVVVLALLLGLLAVLFARR